MTTILKNNLIGNYGEALVTARLSAHCLVRPVAAGTDTGIDLYCETIEKTRPFLHFWVQVKSGKQCKVSHDLASASTSLEIEKLRYWKQQPVPVFVALVPTKWPPAETDIYIIDITEWLLSNELPEQTKLTLTSNHRLRANSSGDITRLLEGVVPKTSAQANVARGVITSTPTLDPAYVQQVPYVPVNAFMGNILNQLRTTANHAILFSLRDSNKRPNDVRTRQPWPVLWRLSKTTPPPSNTMRIFSIEHFPIMRMTSLTKRMHFTKRRSIRLIVIQDFPSTHPTRNSRKY
jgi:hypothetical protein